MQQMYKAPQQVRFEFLPTKYDGKTIYAVYKVMADGRVTEPDYYEEMAMANRYCKYKNEQLATA